MSLSRDARAGEIRPLVVGPAIVAAGFCLFAVLSFAGSYWRTYFPASLFVGFGMAITVAPLTTVVMNSAIPQHTGAASGINNAAARVAGVLAIAVFGAILIHAFDSRLERKLANLNLPSGILSELRATEGELRKMEPPPGLDPNAALEVREAIASSFSFAFRTVLLWCAALSYGGAIIARLLITGPSATTATKSQEKCGV